MTNPILTAHVLVASVQEDLDKIKGGKSISDSLDVLDFSTQQGNLLFFSHDLSFEDSSKGNISKYELEIIDPNREFESRFLDIDILTVLSDAAEGGLRPFFIMYGLQDVNAISWQGPFKAYTSDINYSYTTDGLRKITLTLAPTINRFFLKHESDLDKHRVQGQAPIYQEIKDPIVSFSPETPIVPGGLIFPADLESVHITIEECIRDYIEDGQAGGSIGVKNIIVLLPDLDKLLLHKKENVVKSLVDTFDWHEATNLAEVLEYATMQKRTLSKTAAVGGTTEAEGALVRDNIESSMKMWDKYREKDPEKALDYLFNNINGYSFAWADKFYSDLGFLHSWGPNPFLSGENEFKSALQKYMLRIFSKTSVNRTNARKGLLDFIIDPEKEITPYSGFFGFGGISEEEAENFPRLQDAFSLNDNLKFDPIPEWPVATQEGGTTIGEYAADWWRKYHPIIAINKFGSHTGDFSELAQFLNNGIGNYSTGYEFNVGPSRLFEHDSAKALITALGANKGTKKYIKDSKDNRVLIFGDDSMINTFFGSTPKINTSNFDHLSSKSDIHNWLIKGGPTDYRKDLSNLVDAGLETQFVTPFGTSATTDSFLLGNIASLAQEFKQLKVPIFHSGRFGNSNILNTKLDINHQYLLTLLEGIKIHKDALSTASIVINNSKTLKDVAEDIDDPGNKALIEDKIKNFLENDESIKNTLAKIGESNPSEDYVGVVKALFTLLAWQALLNPKKSGTVVSEYASQAAYINTAINTLNQFVTGTIKTLPYFNISNASQIRDSILLFITEPKAVGFAKKSSSDDITFDSIFSGEYIIHGFKHVISSSEISSNFRVVRNPGQIRKASTKTYDEVLETESNEN